VTDPIEVIHTGEGPYPSPCEACSQTIEAGERYVILQDGRVLHEVCFFLEGEDAVEEPSTSLPEEPA
jgi:hypothetical protein